MCGIFGYIASSNAHTASGLDFDRLCSIARITQARGAHAFGFAWIDASGRLRMFKQAGPISDHLGLLKMIVADGSPRMVIGHTRYATEGDPADNINNHPHPCDGGWIVHNGVIHNYRRILHTERLNPISACDSEVIGLLIEQAPRGNSLVHRTMDAINVLSRSPFAMLGLWKQAVGRMLIARRGNPLHVGVTKSGLYLASLAQGLPGNVKRIDDDTLLEASYRSGRMHLDRHALPNDLFLRASA